MYRNTRTHTHYSRKWHVVCSALAVFLVSGVYDKDWSCQTCLSLVNCRNGQSETRKRRETEEKRRNWTNFDKRKTWHHRVCEYICGISSNLPSPWLFLFVLCFSSSFSRFCLPHEHSDTVPHCSPVTALKPAVRALDGKRKRGKRGRKRWEEERQMGFRRSRGTFDQPAVVWQAGRRRVGTRDFNNNYIRYQKHCLRHALLGGKHYYVHV